MTRSITNHSTTPRAVDRLRRHTLGLVVAVPLLVAACGGASTPAPSSPPASPSLAASPSGASSEPSAGASAALACATGSATSATTVTIKGFAYAPTPVTVKVGEAVTFQNKDGVPHTASMLDGSCDTGTISGGGGSATLVFSAPGTYRYHCRIHPTMPTATVVVEG